MLALQMMDYFKAQARERQATSTGGQNPQLRAELHTADNRNRASRATQEAGQLVGVSARNISHAFNARHGAHARQLRTDAKRTCNNSIADMERVKSHLSSVFFRWPNTAQAWQHPPESRGTITTMHAHHLMLVRALAETLDDASTDGLSAAQALLAAHAARNLANVAEGVEELNEAAAIMHSVADVLGTGGDVSAPLCFLLARNVRNVPGLIGAPAARVVSLHGR